jgi:Fe-S-cluster-containing hydrogenase component 2/thioredoxin reductase
VSRYHIAIIGAGPAGLSAAARAAAHDREQGSTAPSYLLLEAHDTFAKTIHRYQKGKHVMAEPAFLNLRSPIPFAAGRREAVLGAWGEALQTQDINVRYRAEVVAIRGSQGEFHISLQDGDSVEAANVVLAIGTQGNPRSLGVPGDEESDFIAYTLDDADAFKDEDIVVVGAGDAAIENAIALARGNRVTIVNRRAEFSRAKEGNLSAILAAINDRGTALECRYESGVAAVEPPAAPGGRGAIVLSTPAGEARIPCHRIIARLGTIPPRQFVESCGIRIDNPKADALPEVDRRYQSNVPGLYLIGALGGYPLIKQAMNQGYEVVDFIHGLATKPADFELLAAQFGGLPYAMDPEDVLALYQERVPMFRRMNPLAFRELIIESRILLAEEGAPAPPATATERRTLRLPAGHVLYREGEYSSSFFTLVEGAVRLQLEDRGPWHDIAPGEFFGEMSLISGRPRQGSAIVERDSILIETPRRIMAKLMASSEEIRDGIDRVFILRALLAAFRSDLSLQELTSIAGRVGTRTLEAGDALYREGETGDELYLVRRGRIALARGDGRVVNQLQSGELVGQLAVMGAPTRRETALAAVRTELIAIGQEDFLRLAGRSGDYLPVLQARTTETLRRSNAIGASDDAARTMSFLMERGMGEATNALLINESLCIGCDNCERACAETHGGISRVRRRGRESENGWHMAQACLHCELPHCMKDCPTDAIRRSAGGEVFITDACIGCGNCETNCPYDAIDLRYPARRKPGLLAWLLLGLGPGPGDPGGDSGGDSDAAKVAVKCDACRELPGGYACVNACPTGAAIRVGGDSFIDLVKAL